MAIRYSKHFNINPQAFEELGVFNAYIDEDSKFHVDPLLLRGSKIPEFEDAYDVFLNYFRGFVPLVKHVEKPIMTDPFFSRMVDRFTFPELQYTGLGFSEGHSHGNGISGKLSRQLARSAYDIIKAGYEDPEIFALMPLIEDNIGQDRISDMTIAILRKQFLEYTQRISQELGIKTDRCRFSYDEYYDVPYLGKDTIHFIPTIFLNDLFVATSFEDISDACDYNERLKRKLAEIIGVVWQDYSKYTKTDWKNIILGERECYKAAIDYYKSIKGVSYNFEIDEHDKCLDLKFMKLAHENPIQFLSNIFKSPQEKVFKWTMSICEQYKHLVEENRMSELVHRNKRTPDETDWQLILYLIADTYIEAAGLDIKVTREANPGTGEEDFLFSRGKEAQTVIEIKRSGNPNLLHGYRMQLPSYIRADRADHGIFIVIIDDPSHEASVRQQLDDVKKDMVEKGETIYPIIYVRGYHQPSASNPNYTLN